jgi:hypothetical protein
MVRVGIRVGRSVNGSVVGTVVCLVVGSMVIMVVGTFVGSVVVLVGSTVWGAVRFGMISSADTVAAKNAQSTRKEIKARFVFFMVISCNLLSGELYKKNVFNWNKRIAGNINS